VQNWSSIARWGDFEAAGTAAEAEPDGAPGARWDPKTDSVIATVKIAGTTVKIRSFGFL
jgi:hypothetical protein